MAFNKPLPVWNEPGVEVPSAIKNSGWGAGIKPPAPYFNNLHHKTYEALKELQEKAAETAEVQEISENLTEVDERFTQQLAQTELKIPTISNSKDIIRLQNPYGNYQNIHPKVLFFKDSLFGHKYWMAYTPYPGGNTTQENPCLAWSDNGIDFFDYFGYAIEEWSGVTGDYNNDTHLIYNTITGQLEIMWRTALLSQSKSQLKVATYDGTILNAPRIVREGTLNTGDFLSPSVIYEDAKHKMLSVALSSSRWRVFYSESSDNMQTWTEPVQVFVEGLDNTWWLWHIDFIKTDLGYEMVVQAYRTGQSNNDADLYYMQSNDLLNWTKPKVILQKSKSPRAFDNRGIYRSSILKVEGVYQIYYSALNSNGVRAMALTSGENIFALQGYVNDEYVLNPTMIQFGNPTAIPNNRINRAGLTRYVESTNELQIWNGARFVPAAYNGMSPILLNKSTDQTITANMETVIPFDTNVENTDKYYINDTFTSPYDGKYRINASLQFINLSPGDYIEVMVQVGTAKHYLSREYVNGATYTASLTRIFVMAKNTQAKIIVKSSKDTSITRYNTITTLQIERV
ncbi:hypothetical protein NSQ62_14350 [Solibacillus sp. FSL H8-0523]|uniref:hypothetical protein n=1 Tax=Solibacillus sp. FSL H8-0523 TaxID=2954511 RepID=UPI0031019629